MRTSLTLVACAALVVFTSVVASYAQAPAPDSKGPQYQVKGEQDRSYTFPGTGEPIAYHIYEPMKWDRNSKLPLVVLTHGANQPATAPFQRPMQNPTLAKTAEERGYIVAAVTGYHATRLALADGTFRIRWSRCAPHGPAAAAAGWRAAARAAHRKTSSAPRWTCCMSPTSWRGNTTRIRTAST